MQAQTASNKSDKDLAGSIPEVKVLKALGDESRMRAILALRDRELCVCQIVELLQLAHSTVSKHMSILKAAGLVQSRKIGRWVFYRMCKEEPSGLPKTALHVILSTAAKTSRAVIDSRRLNDILKLDPEELCERQNRCKA